MECEMCGRKTSNTTKVRVDHAILNVCDSCAKFGTPVDKSHGYDRLNTPKQEQIRVTIPEKKPQRPRPLPSGKPRTPPKRRENIEDLEIVPEYADLIKHARDRLEWTQEELALKIQEKKNVLSNVESGHRMPDIRLARKLEKVLGITLVESE